MGQLISLSERLTGRDRKLLTEIVQAAQLAQAYRTYAKAEFLSSPQDQIKIVERLRIMSDAAGRLSRRTRQQMPSVPWDDLLAAGKELEGDAWKANLDTVWRLVKKVVPRVVRDIPLGSDPTDPQSVFLTDPITATRRQTPPRGKRKR
jgi:uncharacterized protein with HEPN domain